MPLFDLLKVWIRKLRLGESPSRSVRQRVSGSFLGASFVRLWGRFAPDTSTNGRGPRPQRLSSHRSQFPS